MPRLLVVDDAADFRLFLSQTLHTVTGQEINTAVSGAHAIEKLKQGVAIDLVICDFQMPGDSGLEVFEYMKASDHPAFFILCTSMHVESLPNFEGSKFLGVVPKTDLRSLFTMLADSRKVLDFSLNQNVAI
jgi:CheY-like chemotaxis protein